MASHSDVKDTIGAALAGCLVSVALSAVLGFQTFLYFMIFPADNIQYKVLVSWTWLLDAVHTILICTAVWEFAINNFGNSAITDTIFPALAVLVLITATTTISVNIFYGWRIHKLSRSNWWLTGTITFLSVARGGLAFTTASEMIITPTFTRFNADWKLLLTCGLAVSAVTDIVVSAARYYYLHNLKQGYMMSQEMVDAVVVFTINDGCLTCAVVVASIASLLCMDNFIWLSIYFTIAKFYSNSVLATLNLRNWYRYKPVRTAVGLPMTRPGNGAMSNHGTHTMSGTAGDKHSTHDLETPGRMEVFIDHQVEFVRDDHKDQKSTTIA
ncbi:hypothetical protein DFH07DRAFT_530 [Mycena maculata]|uniref:DUF6534 domain-containing protein n=1 Tax=Mycena maculata TaxID=230809 RepID=A0AAD7KFZ1_9AGAR|nr:hypothetical protein DFH07DRAFT_530 [Mycena maculata]